MAYSHSAQAADHRFCQAMALASPVCAFETERQACAELCERLDERDIADLRSPPTATAPPLLPRL